MFSLGLFWFLFLIFTVYGLCELPTAGKIEVLPFNSDQHAQFREVSCSDLKKLLPAYRVFHCLYWCILYSSSNSTAIIPTNDAWYSHKYIQYYLFPRFESISFLFSCIHLTIHCYELPRTPWYLSRSSIPRSPIMFIIICVSFISLNIFLYFPSSQVEPGLKKHIKYKQPFRTASHPISPA